MILGVVKVEDIYQRLMDTHELPADKAQKIIEEIEAQIFIPLHKKLMDLDAEEEKKIQRSGQESSREDILAEIEKEPEPIIVHNPIPIKITPVEPVVINNPGITKPFSIASTKEIDVQEPMLSTGTVASGVQADPISVGLTQPTVAQAQKPVTKFAADPYRESIE